ncbi:1,4-dihydroxy-2-naphthoate prenyltransferase [Microbispora cellulosiformans]|uniref:1,4-dihydroxy-2-naphthoate prenyltransferase n=1 Tax=Microbispora cellulosiformans TaxID=2614688 RepID=A0A5J5JS54_9ACTN|nr:UbiA family prenyltransferase [Microbispora cellulosiformans]KAA9373299.1 1,4-dihydroxy-2-naphthoate prenyltransferase [Microbispora cellulosiformans]
MTATEPVSGGVGAYARLAKLAFFDFYLSALVVWTLLGPHSRLTTRGLLVLSSLTLAWVMIVAATVAFDDVTGFRDGSDRRNYAPDQVALRSLRRKPLLVGEISVAAAVRFGYLTTLGAVVLLAAAYAIAPYRPGYVVGLMVVVVAVSVQYSYGLRLSYRRAQELVLFLSPALTVVIPTALLTGRLESRTLVEAVLFGLWSLLISVYSNLNDIEGDRLAGRKNVATTASPEGYRVFLVVLTAAELAVIVYGAMRVPVLAVALAPSAAVRGRQLYGWITASDALTARKLGINALRLGVAGLCVANLLTVG